jgi:tetratricopeptide (TPR) repeat protein
MITFFHLFICGIQQCQRKKKRIAFQSDSLNNRGVEFYRSGDIYEAIRYYKQALEIMPK